MKNILRLSLVITFCLGTLVSCGELSKPLSSEDRQALWIKNALPPVKVLLSRHDDWNGVHWVVLSSEGGQEIATFYGTALAYAEPGMILREK